MTKKQDHPSSPKRPRPASDHADARGDFYYDELMTPQPDALREYHRAQLLKPMKPPAKKKKP